MPPRVVTRALLLTLFTRSVNQAPLSPGATSCDQRPRSRPVGFRTSDGLPSRCFCRFPDPRVDLKSMSWRPLAHNFWLKAKPYLYVLQVFRVKCGACKLLNRNRNVLHKFCTSSTSFQHRSPHLFNRRFATENAENGDLQGATNSRPKFKIRFEFHGKRYSCTGK